MVDNIQARYFLDQVTREMDQGHEMTTVRLKPRSRDPFFQLPPVRQAGSGTIEIPTSNPEVARFFNEAELGDEVYVTFTRVKPLEEHVPSTNPSLQAVHASPGSHVSGVKQTIVH